MNRIKNIFILTLAVAATTLTLASCGDRYDPKEIAKIDEADELTEEQTETALRWYEDGLEREIVQLEEAINGVREELLNERSMRIGKRVARAGRRESDLVNAKAYNHHKEKIEALEDKADKLRAELYERIAEISEDLDR